MEISLAKLALFRNLAKNGSGSGSGTGDVDIVPLSVSANGTYTARSGKAYSPVSVNIPIFGDRAEKKDVNFIDYDGTILYSYTNAEFSALRALPANPSHTGLIAQGWNWTLADAKTQVGLFPEQPLFIGQMYTTSDGKTRIYIHIDEGAPANRRVFYVRYMQSVSEGVTIDWGDNTSSTCLTGTSTLTAQHAYADHGDYVVSLEVTEGNLIFATSSSYSIYGSISSGFGHLVHRITKIEIGDSVILGNYCFQQCYGLSSITIPKDTIFSTDHTCHFKTTSRLKCIVLPTSCTAISPYMFEYGGLERISIPNTAVSIGASAFDYCNNLYDIAIPFRTTSIGYGCFCYCYVIQRINIPSGVEQLPGYLFYCCYSLDNIVLPDNLSYIGNSAFYSCYGVTKLTIPSTVTLIDKNAFVNCYGLSEVHILRESPPTLGSSAFSNTPTPLVCYVPYSADHSILNTYKSATNWSSIASKIQEEQP